MLFATFSFHVKSWSTFALAVFLEFWNVAMPLRLSPYARKRIIRLWQQGKTVVSIVKELRKDGISTTRRTVTRRICQWTKGGGLQDQVRPGRPSVITDKISEYLDKMLEDDEELSTSKFNRLIVKKFRLQISAPMIRRFLRLKLNWVTVKAVQWYRMRIRSNMWSLPNVVLLQRTPSKTLSGLMRAQYSLWDMQDQLGSKLERSPTLSQWQSTQLRSMCGQEFQCMGQQDMYLWLNNGCTILCEHTWERFDTLHPREVPTRTPVHARQWPKHTSQLAKAYMEKLSVNWWKTSASSADINPIERVWVELKRYIAWRVKPLSKCDLVSDIVVFWSRQMTQDKCIKYIRHVNKGGSERRYHRRID